MDRVRIYQKSECVIFRKTTEKWGGLSNMAKDYPICVNGVDIQSSEILYQSLSFTHCPDIQRKILNERNPMYAKRLARKYILHTRDNWDVNRISIMKWCIAVKLCQNWEKFSKILFLTYPNYIVEYSEKDLFWGASYDQSDKNLLIGENILGRILMQMREIAREKGKSAFETIFPLPLENFSLLGEPIRIVSPLTNNITQQGSFNF